MLEFSEEMKRVVFANLDKDERKVLLLAKSIMDKTSYIKEHDPEMADVFRSISALLLNLQDLEENGQ